MSEETYEKLRIARISDCVFAIAMTLLVFDLKMPVLGQRGNQAGEFRRGELRFPGSGRAYTFLVVFAGSVQ